MKLLSHDRTKAKMSQSEKKQEPSGYTWEMCKIRKEEKKKTTINDKLKALKKDLIKPFKKKD